MVYLFTLIKGWIYRGINFVIGRTKFFIIILGWFLVITGILFLLRPEKARKKLLGQGFGFIKWPLRIALIYLILMLLSFAFGASNQGLQIASLCGIVFAVWAFVFLKKKAYEKLSGYFAKIPMPYLKAYACLQIAVGVLMLIFQRRIW